MAGETTGAFALLDNSEHIPIAQLSPELSTALKSMSIKAVVTLTWPYSSATGSMAFLLSEPDFRLRRKRGQVRVRFSGSCAKAVAASGIASGDEVIVSLDGVEWVSNDTTIITPGSGIEHELSFNERLLLEFRPEDSQQVKRIDLDHPPPAEPAAVPAQIPLPEPEEPLLPISTPFISRTVIGTKIGDEWSSPAFMKRARLSYGSLYESDYDIFAEEDGTIPGKGRKKTRLSSSWTYMSRSPTPEVEEAEVESMDTSPEPASARKPAPAMTDEGCQTVDFVDSDETEDVAQALADFSRQAVNVGSAAYPKLNGSAPFGSPGGTGKLAVNGSYAEDSPKTSSEIIARGQEIPEVEPPKSPRLLPVPSEFLSLVSPLLTKNHNSFFQLNGECSLANTDQLLDRRSTSPVDGLFSPEESNSPKLLGDRLDEIQTNGNALANDVVEEEDIYTASPAGRQDQEPESDFSGFLEQEVAHDGMEIPIFNNQFIAENQYGHWLSAGAQLSNTASPRNEPFMEGSHGNMLNDNTEELLEVEEQLGPSVEMPLSDYPELTDGLSGQITSTWGASSVAYPALPDYGDQAPFAHQSPRSSAMSRSESAQSAVVDLTESDGEAHPEDELQRSENDSDVEGESEEEGILERRVHTVDQHDDHRDDGDFEDEVSDEVGTSARPNTNYEDVDADADGEEEGDYEEDEDEEEFHTKLRAAFGSDQDDDDQMEDYNQDEEGSYDEDEGSYDEEELDDEDLPPPKSRLQPEVIDLLSSDEEDETPAKATVPTANSQRSSPTKHVDYPQIPENSSGDGNDESDIDEEEALPSEEMSEIETKISEPRDYASSLDDEAVDEADNDDMSGDELPTDTVLFHGGSGSEKEGSEESNPEFDLQEADIETEEATHEELSTAVSQELLARANEATEDSNSELAAPAIEEVNIVEPSECLEPPRLSESGSAEVDSPVKSITTAPPRRASPEKRSLFNSIFGLDGAHDEPRFGASYRSMSREDGTLPSSVFLQGVFSKAPSDSIPKENNLQLPTPEDTQIPRKTVSVETSFASVNESHQRSDVISDELDIEMVDTSRDNPADEAEEKQSSSEASSPIMNIQTLSETVTLEVFEDTEMTENDGYGIETHTEEIRYTTEVIQTIDKSSSEEIHGSVESSQPAQEESPGRQDESIEGDEAIIEHETIEDDESAQKDMSVFDQPVEENEPVEEHEPVEGHGPVEEHRPVEEHEPGEEHDPVGEPKPVESDTIEEDEEINGSDHEADDVLMMESIARALVLEQQSGIGPSSLRSHDGEGESRRHPQSIHGVTTTDEPESHTESPRRSSRINPSLKAAVNQKENVRPATPNKTTTTNTKETRESASPLKAASPLTTKATDHTGPVTPLKSRGATTSTSPENEESPLVVFKNLETPKGHDASVEFALEASDASSPPQHNLRKPPVDGFKLRLKRALRTELSEFTSLKVLRYHLTKKLDFLAVATTTPPEPQRAKNGPRQYQITFNITDPSIAPSGVTEVQVFRPYKDALPIIKAGDGILLRNFLVMSVQQSRTGGPAFALRSTQEDASSWAVFKDDTQVEIRGPPVEYGDAEKNHVMQLKKWYAELDDLEVAKIARANGDKGAPGSSAKKRGKA